LARQFGWRVPFFAVASLGLAIAIFVVIMLPPLRGHLVTERKLVPLSHLFAQRNVVLSWTMTFVVMGAGFIIIPNISAYVQFNLSYPRARLGLLYLYGGLVSFFTTQIAGRLIDRLGSFRVGTAGTVLPVFALPRG